MAFLHSGAQAPRAPLADRPTSPPSATLRTAPRPDEVHKRRTRAEQPGSECDFAWVIAPDDVHNVTLTGAFFLECNLPDPFFARLTFTASHSCSHPLECDVPYLTHAG